jgi:NAD(P)-dependent dehydrogenase (short-subunit alcohol dehydrogenase family)
MRDDRASGTSVSGAVVLVTGASGGIGQALVAALRHAGAAEVIAADRNASQWPTGVTGLELDVTQPEAAARAAAEMGRVDILINNAGVNANQRLFAPGFSAAARQELEVNYFGLLNMAEAFAPAMQKRGRGVIVNLLTFLGHVNLPLMASYCASKAAAHSITQALRAELGPSGVRVLGVYPTVVDTQMSRNVPTAKLSPAQLALDVIEAIRSGEEDLYPGTAAQAYQELLADPKQVEHRMAMRVAAPRAAPASPQLAQMAP